MRKFMSKRGETDGFTLWLVIIIYIWVTFQIGNKDNEILNAVKNLANDQQSQISQLRLQLSVTNSTIEDLNRKLQRASDHAIEK